MAITRSGTYSQIKGSTIKAPCLVATTTNVNLTAGNSPTSVDGVTLSVGDRVLVYQQTSGSSNGIYVASGTTWTRSVDMSISEDVFMGIQVYVNSGTLYGGKLFKLSTADPITLGSTSLTFEEIVFGTATGTVEAKDAGYTVVLADNNKTFTCNSTISRNFYLPSVTSSEIGYEYTFVKLGTGDVVILAADSDIIQDSGEGMSVYCSDAGIANITLKLVTSTLWIIKFANGTWVTTV